MPPDGPSSAQIEPAPVLHYTRPALAAAAEVARLGPGAGMRTQGAAGRREERMPGGCVDGAGCGGPDAGAGGGHVRGWSGWEGWGARAWGGLEGRVGERLGRGWGTVAVATEDAAAVTEAGRLARGMGADTWVRNVRCGSGASPHFRP